jgi:hypothetical protein
MLNAGGGANYQTNEERGMLRLKDKLKTYWETIVAGANDTGNVSATVDGKPVMLWQGTPTQKDGTLKMFPVARNRMMPELSSLGDFADAAIANVADKGLARDAQVQNVQRLAMLWRTFTTPVPGSPGVTYGDLIGRSNLHAAFTVVNTRDDTFRVEWKVAMSPGRN